MSTLYPGSVDDTSTFPVVVDNTTTVIAAHHNNQSDALIAVETKIGTGASTPTSGTVLRGNGTGTSTWGDVVLTTDVTGTLPVANGGTGVTASTGTVAVVLSTSPTLVTPILGVATATSINKVAITAPATSATLTIADGKTLTASNTITFTATDGSTLAIGAGGTLGTGAYATIANYATLASPTFTGTVTLPKTLEIQDTSADHQYVLAVNELAADRIVTLPLLAGNDEFVFKDHAVTMTNKTLTSPKINEDVAVTSTATEINTATDGSVVWTAFVPTVTAPGGTAPTYDITATGKYCQIGKVVTVQFFLQGSVAGTVGAGAVRLLFSLPVTAAQTESSDNNIPSGMMGIYNGADGGYCLVQLTSTTTFGGVRSATSTLQAVDQNNATRLIWGFLTYEAA